MFEVTCSATPVPLMFGTGDRVAFHCRGLGTSYYAPGTVLGTSTDGAALIIRADDTGDVSSFERETDEVFPLSHAPGIVGRFAPRSDVPFGPTLAPDKACACVVCGASLTYPDWQDVREPACAEHAYALSIGRARGAAWSEPFGDGDVRCYASGVAEVTDCDGRPWLYFAAGPDRDATMRAAADRVARALRGEAL